MPEKIDLLTNEEAREYLGERVPGFAQVLAAALKCTPRELFEKLERGEVTKLQAIEALAWALLPKGTTLTSAGPEPTR